jgi:histidyl-tRNA synthetase
VSVTKARMGADKALPRKTHLDVYVMASGGGKDFNGLYRERKKIYQTLQKAGIAAEISWKTKPRLPKEFKAAEDLSVSFAVILGQDEWEKGLVKVKEMGLPPGHPEKEGVDVALDDLVEDVKAKLSRVAEALPVREKN